MDLSGFGTYCIHSVVIFLQYSRALDTYIFPERYSRVQSWIS